MVLGGVVFFLIEEGRNHRVLLHVQAPGQACLTVRLLEGKR